MSDLTSIEQRKLESFFHMEHGYFLDHTNDSLARLVEQSVGIDLYSEKYFIYSNSKANRMRAIWKLEPNILVAKLIRDIIEDYSNVMSSGSNPKSVDEALKNQCLMVAARLESSNRPSANGIFTPIPQVPQYSPSTPPAVSPPVPQYSPNTPPVVFPPVPQYSPNTPPAVSPPVPQYSPNTQPVVSSTVFQNGPNTQPVVSSTAFQNGPNSQSVGSSTVSQNGPNSQSVGSSTVSQNGPNSQSAGSSIVPQSGPNSQSVASFPENDEVIKNKVFIVHGHDELAKEKLARFIANVGLEPIILHEQVSSSKTIIEKFLDYANEVCFAIVIYSPCDVGSKRDAEELAPRARQNVVFEHGFFIGKLGREKVIAIMTADLEKPNDISGVIYETFDERGAWKYSLAREMNVSGCDIDLNKII